MIPSIKSKFTRKGNYHDEAIHHLKSLGLKEEAERSGAAELGQNICEALIAPFLEAQRGQTDVLNSSVTAIRTILTILLGAKFASYSFSIERNESSECLPHHKSPTSSRAVEKEL